MWTLNPRQGSKIKIGHAPNLRMLGHWQPGDFELGIGSTIIKVLINFCFLSLYTLFMAAIFHHYITLVPPHSLHIRRDWVRNDDIRERLGVTRVEEKLVQHRLRWFGHIQQRPTEAPIYNGVIRWTCNKKRSRWRPNLTWEETVKRDLKDWCITKELVLDRREWKLAIHVLEPWFSILSFYYLLSSFFSLLFCFFDLAFYCLFSFLFDFFIVLCFFLLFCFCFIPFFSYVVLSLAYSNLFENKMLSCCCVVLLICLSVNPCLLWSYMKLIWLFALQYVLWVLLSFFPGFL
jgi:hypothetical protein